LLYLGKVDEAFSDSYVENGVQEDLDEFVKILSKHREVLNEGKESVKKLIKKNFSLEDVLFQKMSFSRF
jgi:hypothetical protein